MDEHEETTAQPSPSPSTAAAVGTPGQTPRRSLKRNSAACERCRKRKQKCDGRLPSCSACLHVQAPCVPSDRLLIRADPNCQCDVLKERVRDLENQLETLQGASSTSTGRQDPTYHGRILRPTFAESRGGSASGPAFRGSPWQLWAGDPDCQTPQNPSAGDSNQSALPIDATALVEIFFTNRWPQLPLLHKPTFLHDDFLPLTRGDPGNPLSSFRVNMVLAIASTEASARHQHHKLQRTHQDFFRVAIQDLSIVLAASDLDCVQCLLLICLYGANEPQSVNIWYTLGLALRIGLGIDFHREEASSSEQSLLAREMARRLFWCTYTLDRSMSIAMGRPLGINDSDVTTPLPQQLTDDQLSSAHDDVTPQLIQSPKDVSTFLHVIKLRQINAAIYTSLHAASASASSASDGSLDALREMHYTALNTWLVTAPRYEPGIGVAMLQTAEWFQIAYHYAVLSLYRPSRVFPASNLASLRLCADSAITLISCYNTLYAKNRISYTFVALNSLFMASVTMLYALRSSSVLRGELGKSIAKANIDMCRNLLRGISTGRAVGERCAVIVGRLGDATLSVFDREEEQSLISDGLDTEFMSWFGLKMMQKQQSASEAGFEQATPSIDIPWNDLFIGGFDGFDGGNHDYLEIIA